MRDAVEPAQIASALLAALERAVEQDRDKQGYRSGQLEREASYRAALLLELSRADDRVRDLSLGAESD